MQSSLAIIIPAYKASYLKECLESIYKQTNKNFSVYIGNDNSPEQLEDIIVPFLKFPNFFYKKFEENMGGISLVNHWKRCISLNRGEEWIWLFSDDDTMEENCVECFYEYLSTQNIGDIIRFPLNLINKNNQVLVSEKYSDKESARSFLINRFHNKYYSAITNYVFTNSVYQEYGFQDFPLAYCTDDAAVIEYAESKPIHTLQKCFVNWRTSPENISTNISDEAIVIKKIDARIAFLKWVILNEKRFKFGKSCSDRLLATKWLVNSIKIDGAVLAEIKRRALISEALKTIKISKNKYLFFQYIERRVSQANLLLRSIKWKLIKFF